MMLQILRVALKVLVIVLLSNSFISNRVFLFILCPQRRRRSPFQSTNNICENKQLMRVNLL